MFVDSFSAAEDLDDDELREGKIDVLTGAQHTRYMVMWHDHSEIKCKFRVQYPKSRQFHKMHVVNWFPPCTVLVMRVHVYTIYCSQLVLPGECMVYIRPPHLPIF